MADFHHGSFQKFGRFSPWIVSVIKTADYVRGLQLNGLSCVGHRMRIKNHCE